MARRGPDGSGLWLGRHVFLGHRRLAVIDPARGQQPMSITTPAGAVTLVFTGECYNFRSLRQELRDRGHVFRTESDTEVVLTCYLEWADKLVHKLDGMYAFAIWDERMERLLLVRDRLGVKPLYYCPDGSTFVFGSEPKAIFAYPGVRRAVDLEGLRELFAWARSPGECVWKGLYEVAPGGYLSVDRSGVKKVTYWALEAAEHHDDLLATISRTRALLQDAVAGQLVSDVPLGVLLSGGLDSSAITTLVASLYAGWDAPDLRTYSVDFQGQSDSFVPNKLIPSLDSPFVEQMTKHVSSIHRTVLLSPHAVASPVTRRETVMARDLPDGLGEMDYSLYLLCSAVRQDSTVVLSGESADELFGGYYWYHELDVQNSDSYPWFRGRPAADFCDILILEPGLKRRLALDEYICQRYSDAVRQASVAHGQSELDSRLQRMCFLHLTRYLQMMLDRKDRLGMAVGLEIRVPFCDHHLVEYVYNVPWHLKSFDGREKSLLRAAVGDLLPAVVAQRVKSAFPAPSSLDYTISLQRQVMALDAKGDAAFSVFDQRIIQQIATMKPQYVSPPLRAALERTLNFSTWLEVCDPGLELA
jgi:asparagine synthase (glutamine-hydrolysing)